MKNLVITGTERIHDAFNMMSEAGEKCLVVVDPGGRVIGTLSDGDLRRGILSGKTLDHTVEDLYFRSPTVLEEGMYSQEQLRDLFLENRFDVIPIIDSSGNIVDIHTWDEALTKKKAPTQLPSNLPVVIMAGGRGTRLEPFTKVLPKPLIPIDGKPVIEHIISSFTAAGINEFYLTVNYKSRIMRAFFEEGERDYTVNFVEESDPLGTAGSLKMLEGTLSDSFFVTNCDVLIDLDLGSLEQFHRERGNAATLVASARKFVIPYGKCLLDESGDLEKIEEKPEHNYLVNAGLYLLDPDVLALIEAGEFLHITSLLERVRGEGGRVGVFPVGENSWIDVGQWSEYQKATEAFRKS